MGFHRWSLILHPVNVSDCFDWCPGACSVDGCVASLPPPPLPKSNDVYHQNRHLSNFFIAAGSLIAAIFFLAVIYYAVLSHRKRRCGTPLEGRPNADDSDFSEVGEGGHHVWQIRTVGLDESTIGSIAVFEYKAEDGLLGRADADCSVCLGEFRDGEHVRLLPKCAHAFHVTCIDTWLLAHVNCPLCRADIVAPTADPAPPSPPLTTSIAHSMEGDSGSSVVLGNSQMGIQPLESVQGEMEGEGEDGGMERALGVVIDPSAASSSLPSRVLSDFGEAGLRPVRRSVSLILLPFGSSLPRVEPEQSFCEEGKDPNFRGEHSSKDRGKQGNASKESSLQSDPLEMDKSLSSSGRGFFFSKFGRSRSMILPL